MPKILCRINLKKIKFIKVRKCNNKKMKARLKLKLLLIEKNRKLVPLWLIYHVITYSYILVIILLFLVINESNESSFNFWGKTVSQNPSETVFENKVI